MQQLHICPCGHRWETASDAALESDSTLVCPACGASLAVPAEEWPPRPSVLRPRATSEAPRCDVVRPVLPGYEILCELGRGAMGVVYQARQEKLRRMVALKMILSGPHAGAADLTRFRAEAEAIARLQHPNIVQIHEVGEQGGLPFLSLEFCGGGSLEKKLAGSPQPPKEAASLVETLARAMQAAHAKGVIHRDLKPANVLLGEDGTPKITDFGLAKKLDETGQTASGAIIGTPSYMAPEQAAGKSKEIGPGCDIYALGAILYELLTGRPPFKAATMLDTIHQVMTEEPVPPRRLQPRIPADLETACLKCLEKQSARRYLSAQALADDLHCFLAGEPLKARPLGVFGRVARWVQRSPAQAALWAVSTFTALTLVGGAVALAYSTRLQEANTKLEAAYKDLRAINEELDNAGRQRQEALRMARRYQYIAQMGLVQRAWRETRVPLMIELLEEQRRPQPDLPDLPGFEWHYLWGVCHGEQINLPCPGSVHDVAFSPDGRLIASAEMGRARLWDSEGRLVRSLEGHRVNASVSRVVFSHDGSRLATAGFDKTVKVWEVSSGRTLLTLAGHAHWVTCVDFSPDGKRLASSSEDGTVIIWDCRTGQPIMTFRGHKQPVECARFSPDGQRIASAARELGVGARIWNADSGRELFTVGGQPGNTWAVANLAFRQDGRLVATSGSDGKVRLWDAQNGSAVRTLSGHSATVLGVAFDIGGGRLASGSMDRTLVVWDLNTGERRLLTAAQRRLPC